MDAILKAGDSENKITEVLKGSLNMTSNAIETLAFGVSSVLAQFALKNEVPPSSGGGTTNISNRVYTQQDISVGGVLIWNPSWAALDKDVIRRNRGTAIAEGLKNDSHYSSKKDQKFIDY